LKGLLTVVCFYWAQISDDEIVDKWKAEAIQAARDKLREKREGEEREKAAEWERWEDDPDGDDEDYVPDFEGRDGDCDQYDDFDDYDLDNDDADNDDADDDDADNDDVDDDDADDDDADDDDSDGDEEEERTESEEEEEKEERTESSNEEEEEEQSTEHGKGGNRLARWPFYYVPRDESMMTSAMADYCIAELRHKAKEFGNSTSGAIIVFNGDVVKSDKAVSLETKKALQKAVEPLEKVPNAHKDWQPGSDGKVLGLVHPSLFPLVYGKSKVLDVGEKVVTLEDFANRSGEGDVIPRPDSPRVRDVKTRWSRESMNPFSIQFQWLPCEVDITGDKPKYASHG
jgi:Protein of unknown function (DUF4246)